MRDPRRNLMCHLGAIFFFLRALTTRLQARAGQRQAKDYVDQAEDHIDKAVDRWYQAVHHIEQARAEEAGQPRKRWERRGGEVVEQGEFTGGVEATGGAAPEGDA